MNLDHEKYMQYCIDIANKGVAAAMPNPCVGAVVVYNDQIIGEGYTDSFGGSHAEVNAITSVKDQSLLPKCTLYVTMEPCCHVGKTPACTDLIIKSGIRRVVIGAKDTFSAVNGKGTSILLAQKIKVITPIMEDACRFLNRRFYTFHEKKRPYVILKWAETIDGFIDKSRVSGDVGINWITGHETNKLTHTWRSKEAAIAVGTNTVKNDNPSLTTRHVDGKNPIRVVIDREADLSLDASVFNLAAPTLVFNSKEDSVKDNVTWIKVDFDNLVQELLSQLYQREIQSVIIEGGKQFTQSFLDLGMWDEIRKIVGGVSFTNGLTAPETRTIRFVNTSYLFGDTIYVTMKDMKSQIILENITDLRLL